MKCCDLLLYNNDYISACKFARKDKKKRGKEGHQLIIQQYYNFPFSDAFITYKQN